MCPQHSQQTTQGYAFIPSSPLFASPQATRPAISHNEVFSCVVVSEGSLMQLALTLPLSGPI